MRRRSGLKARRSSTTSPRQRWRCSATWRKYSRSNRGTGIGVRRVADMLNRKQRNSCRRSFSLLRRKNTKGVTDITPLITDIRVTGSINSIVLFDCFLNHAIWRIFIGQGIKKYPQLLKWKRIYKLPRKILQNP